MPLTSITTQTIYDRMKADFSQKMGSSNWLSRSICLILIAVFAGSISLVYGFLNTLFEQLIPTLANDEWFPWHARFFGVNQIIATPAKYNYTFTGIDTTTIDEGTKLVNDAGVVFLTDEDATIASGEAEVGITAQISGVDANLDLTGAADVTLTLVATIKDIDDEGTVTEQTQVGTAAETTDAWKTRLLQRIQNPPSCGNKTDYERWALQGGAGRAWIYAAADWSGPGTVGIVVATESFEAVGSSVMGAIGEIIEAERPVCSSYDLVDPAIKDITFDISISPNSSYFQGAIDDALENMFLVQSIPGSNLLLSQLNKTISNTGVDDFEITAIYEDLVSIGVANIEQSGIGLSRFDGVTYSVLT